MIAADVAEELEQLANLAKLQQPTGVGARFYIDPQLDEEETKKQGYRKFKDVEMVEVRIAGDIDIKKFPASDTQVVNSLGDRLSFKEQFPKEYLAFKQGITAQVVNGTPIAEWPLLSPAQVEEARYAGIHSVEQLANVPDSNMSRLGGGWTTLRNKARDYIAKSKDGAILSKLRERIDDLERMLATQEAMLKKQTFELQQVSGGKALVTAVQDNSALEQMQAQIAALVAAQTLAAQPKRRGRPPKVKPVEVPVEVPAAPPVVVPKRRGRPPKIRPAEVT